ncbi:tRNA (adenosine(37)-N6)-threonylcarbamoyltransferase complex ATPase subunit type 1 TsaE [Candidatus Gracilibacteria bacterium]|nr:tRNA (adenosine(37)-N6)-threonylcarbamoyltransferase complex ATPase subunit type 1 TsaE [Candidatus Gracilibacteria bacterium]
MRKLIYNIEDTTYFNPMQEAQRFLLDISFIATEESLKNHIFPLKTGDRIFFTGDLGSGKSSYIRTLLRSHFDDDELVVRSPTYTYFQKYGDNIYHFDLYRLTSYEDFFLIGGEDIIDNPESICLIEWPEILGTQIDPTLKIFLEKLSLTERKITLFRPDGATE